MSSPYLLKLNALTKILEARLSDHLNSLPFQPHKVLCVNFSKQGYENLTVKFPKSQITAVTFKELAKGDLHSAEEEIELILINLSLGQNLDVHKFLLQTKKSLTHAGIIIIPVLDIESRKALLTLKDSPEGTDNTDIIQNLPEVSLYKFYTYKEHLLDVVIKDKPINCDIFFVCTDKMVKTYELMMSEKMFSESTKLMSMMLDKTKKEGESLHKTETEATHEKEELQDEALDKLEKIERDAQTLESLAEREELGEEIKESSKDNLAEVEQEAVVEQEAKTEEFEPIEEREKLETVETKKEVEASIERSDKELTTETTEFAERKETDEKTDKTEENETKKSETESAEHTAEFDSSEAKEDVVEPIEKEIENQNVETSEQKESTNELTETEISEKTEPTELVIENEIKEIDQEIPEVKEDNHEKEGVESFEPYVESETSEAKIESIEPVEEKIHEQTIESIELSDQSEKPEATVEPKTEQAFDRSETVNETEEAETEPTEHSADFDSFAAEEDVRLEREAEKQETETSEQKESMDEPVETEKIESFETDPESKVSENEKKSLESDEEKIQDEEGRVDNEVGIETLFEPAEKHEGNDVKEAIEPVGESIETAASEIVDEDAESTENSEESSDKIIEAETAVEEKIPEHEVIEDRLAIENGEQELEAKHDSTKKEVRTLKGKPKILGLKPRLQIPLTQKINQQTLSSRSQQSLTKIANALQTNKNKMDLHYQKTTKLFNSNQDISQLKSALEKYKSLFLKHQQLINQFLKEHESTLKSKPTRTYQRILADHQAYLDAHKNQIENFDELINSHRQ